MNVIFSPYCNFATNGFSEMKLYDKFLLATVMDDAGRVRGVAYVNILLLMVKGIGRIRNMNSAISAISSMNTCD